MRLTAVCILSIFAGFPAFANVRLPVVNIGAGSVSARAAFGERIDAKTASAKVFIEKPIVDSGEVIAMAGSADILAPRRPSGDLWARMEKPLRLPEPQEISVI
ncbi:MAG: hypothetical protein LBF28_03200, partial [Rickettsiales bacterium]|nr:hypothetical protein [Rickettsiales bacterium]